MIGWLRKLQILKDIIFDREVTGEVREIAAGLLPDRLRGTKVVELRSEHTSMKAESHLIVMRWDSA